MEAHFVRLAEPEDLAGVLRLYKELRPSDPELPAATAGERWKQIMESPDLHIVVAEAQGSLASTCMLAIVANLASVARPIGLVEHVVTLEQFRGRGLARAVLSFALDLAWSRDCCKVMEYSGPTA
jgi:GNAT superfamily N-acetyltransferase